MALPWTATHDLRCDADCTVAAGKWPVAQSTSPGQYPTQVKLKLMIELPREESKALTVRLTQYWTYTPPEGPWW